MRLMKRSLPEIGGLLDIPWRSARRVICYDSSVASARHASNDPPLFATAEKVYSVYAGFEPRESDTGIRSIIYHRGTFGWGGPSGHAGV